MNISNANSVVNSSAFRPASGIAYRLPRMERPPLTADAKAAQKRLREMWDRLRTGPNRVSQEMAAQRMGFDTQSAVSQYLNGVIPLNLPAVIKFARFFGCEPRDIYPEICEGAVIEIGKRASLNEDDWEDVLGFDQAVGLGNGAEPTEYAEVHKLKFKTTSLQKKKIKPVQLRVFYGRGDSMFPRIKDGDAVLFDISDTHVQDEAIYIVMWRGEYYAKRSDIIDGTVFFKSDNQSGDHQWRKAKAMDNPKDPITVIGRVRWIGSWED